MSMLGQMIRATSFRQFLDFASPTFFDVMPAKALWNEGKSLLRDYRDGDGFAGAVSERRDKVESFGVDLNLNGRNGRPLSALGDGERQDVGQRILEVYFHQLLDGGPTLLDLSAKRWSRSNAHLTWQPGRGHKVWQEGFRQALAEVYLSFYLGQGDLESALDRLGLAVATDLFVQHFGEGDQRAVRFEVEHFTSSFHQVFLRCREHGVKLAPDFLPLGICLATLYESLSTLAVPLDVRQAFEVAAGSRS